MEAVLGSVLEIKRENKSIAFTFMTPSWVGFLKWTPHGYTSTLYFKLIDSHFRISMVEALRVQTYCLELSLHWFINI